jgi:hypothetical protein
MTELIDFARAEQMKSKPSLDPSLPSTIGRPAMRALLAAGINSLEDVARVSDAELAALHGVGPKAIRILRATLNVRQSDVVPGARKRSVTPVVRGIKEKKKARR